MATCQGGVRDFCLPHPVKTAKGIEVPAVLAVALKSATTERAIFERMRPSCQKEYVKWVAEAKKPETQARRVAQALEQIAAWGEEHPTRPGCCSGR